MRRRSLPKSRKRWPNFLRPAIRETCPGCADRDPNSFSQFQYTLVGSNGAEVRQWGGKLLARLRTDPRFRSVNSVEEDEGLATNVVDRVRAGQFGVSLQSISDILNDAFAQRQISTIYGQANQYRVIPEVDRYRNRPIGLASSSVARRRMPRKSSRRRTSSPTRQAPVPSWPRRDPMAYKFPWRPSRASKKRRPCHQPPGHPRLHHQFRPGARSIPGRGRHGHRAVPAKDRHARPSPARSPARPPSSAPLWKGNPG